MKKYEYAIIGAGSAGLSARREIAKATNDYVVIDDGILGTTCARVGCMPSKVLIQVAEDFYRKNKYNEQGIHFKEITLDTKEVMAHVRKLRDRFVRGVMGGMSWQSETNFIAKRARFVDANTLDLGDEKIKANKIIIGTGSAPIIPEQLKGYKDYLVTTDEFFELEDLPKSIAVVGLGVIGIELGQALSRLGVKTTLVARRRIIAGVSDPVIREYVCKKMESEYDITFDGITEIEEKDGKLKLKSLNKEFVVDKILVTAGRAPNLKSLSLECLKLNYDGFGIPLHSKETFALDDCSNIYLPGDVNGDKPLLHEASDEGKVAAINAISSNKNPYKMRTPLEITFSDPNIAKVGQSHMDLTDSKTDFVTGVVSFEGQGRSIIKLKEVGLLHIYGSPKNGKILGAEIFGPDAEHIAHLLSWVVEMELTVNKVLSFPFYHPVIEEGLRTALRDLRDKCEEPVPRLEIFEKE